jgi:hypothetical protein
MERGGGREGVGERWGLWGGVERERESERQERKGGREGGRGGGGERETTWFPVGQWQANWDKVERRPGIQKR